MMKKVYLNNELSNNDYHKESDHINGSSLWEILNDCPGKWRYRDRMTEEEEADHFVFGTGGHTCLLEPERFDKEYARIPVESDYPKEEGKPQLLTTVSSMNSWAKERGIKSLSGKNKEEVIKIIHAAEPDALILDVLRNRSTNAAKEKGMSCLDGDDYDAIMQMRRVIHANSYYSSLLKDAYTEVSLFAKFGDIKSKVRFDVLTKGADIIDYKTSATAKPEDFFRQAARMGYFMKMAMQHDLFMAVYGKPPRSVNLLVQEKKSPFIPVLIRLSDEQLNIGRIQLRNAMALYSACKKADSWPGYNMGSPVIEMETPVWFKKQFGMA